MTEEGWGGWKDMREIRWFFDGRVTLLSRHNAIFLAHSSYSAERRDWVQIGRTSLFPQMALRMMDMANALAASMCRSRSRKLL
jgi:hypothetical protein